MKNKAIAALILIASLFLLVLPVLALFGLHRKIVPLEVVSDMDARGRTNGLIVWVRGGIEYYQSTVEHEYEHVRQKWLGSLILPALVSWTDWYKRSAESRAYAVSVKYDRPVDSCANAAAQYFGGDAGKARRAILKQL